MLDGIFKLLKLEAALVMAVLGLLLKMGIWLADLLTRLVPSKAHPHVESQPEFTSPQPVQTSPPPPATNQASLPVRQPVADPLPTATEPDRMPSSGGRLGSHTLAILNAVDHGIWVAGVDDFIVPHPRAEELLEHLDKMMYVAAHRDGNPFTITRLDTSDMALEKAPELHIDDGFDDVPLRALPAPDGLAWRISSGRSFTRMPTATPRPQKPQPAIEIVAVPLLMAEDDVFSEGVAKELPEPDHQIWMVAMNQPVTRLPPRQAPHLARTTAS